MINSTKWYSHYQSPDPSLWQGRADTAPKERFFQLIHMLDLQHSIIPDAKNLSFGIVGFCCDFGIERNLGRVGAASGPSVLRSALAKLAVHATDLIIYDCGNIFCKNGDLNTAQSSLGSLIAELIAKNIIPIVLGGGHETAWGHYQGIALAKPKAKLGIINFDAHFDLRDLPTDGIGTSGTPFLQIANARKKMGLEFSYYCLGIQKLGNTKNLFKTAQKLGVQYLEADKIHLEPLEHYLPELDKFVAQQDAIYISLCLDVFASSFAPGVSAPQPLGLFPGQVVALLRHLVASKKVVSFDLVELSPPLDEAGKTAQLGAALIGEFVHGF